MFQKSWFAQFRIVLKVLIQVWYRAFHRSGQAKFHDGGSNLGSSKYSILP